MNQICVCGHLLKDHNWGQLNAFKTEDSSICSKCPEHDPCWEFVKLEKNSTE